MRSPRRGDSFTWLVIALAAVLLFAALWPYLLRSTDDHPRQPNCLVNLHLLRLAAVAYAQDYDGRFPREPAPGGDWMVWDWSAVAVSKGRHREAMHMDGPVYLYTKNFRLTRCPEDPSQSSPDSAKSPHSSYTWNNALCGKLLKNVSVETPLVWDRAPFHQNGRNVARVSGKCARVAEKDFAPLLAN